MGIVDFHVHCRESKSVEGSAENIGHVLRVAELAKVDGVGDMPNLPEPIIYRRQVVERLEAARAYGSDVFYGLHIGMTSDREQICRAVDTYRKFFPKEGDRVGVIGLKMFAGRSTGNLEIIDEGEQGRVYETLGNCGYEGVLVVHCEDESLMRPERWDPDVPRSHSFARPAVAESESARKQIMFAYSEGLKALHIAHVSTSATVGLVDVARSNYGSSDVRSMRITCGVTPHHLFVNYDMMKDMTLKVNPPLRSPKNQQGLLDCLKMGKINQIESDHAPHLLARKTGEALDDDKNPIYMSGIPVLDSWPKVIRRLKNEGFDDDRIRMLTRDNVLRNYGIPDGVVGNSEGVGDLNLNEYPYGYGDLI